MLDLLPPSVSATTGFVSTTIASCVSSRAAHSEAKYRFCQCKRCLRLTDVVRGTTLRVRKRTPNLAELTCQTSPVATCAHAALGIFGKASRTTRISGFLDIGTSHSICFKPRMNEKTHTMTGWSDSSVFRPDLSLRVAVAVEEIVSSSQPLSVPSTMS